MSDHDVVIVGGGHNALVAAAYLARAGRQVTVLERLNRVGGAAVSEEPFAGIEARLSRYSYLVSLLPARIIRELGLDVHLRRRRYSSYTPLPGGDRGLLIDHHDRTATAHSFAALGAASDAAAWGQFYADQTRLARAVFPTMCESLLRRSELRGKLGDDALWSSVIDRPIGETIERTFTDDLVRGVVLTDALIGTFSSAMDASLTANRCFLYHVIGNGTGDWDVPIGGMGAVSGALESAARRAGATIVTGAEVAWITPDGEVAYRHLDRELTIGATTVLAGVAPAVLDRMLEAAPGERARPDPSGIEVSASSTSGGGGPEGSQVKVNLLLRRLPQLREPGIDPAAAFGGTFHVNETYSQLESAYRVAAAGSLPDPVPVEVYCHTLTDPSILSPELAASGAHTMTVFGLHAPHRLVQGGVTAAQLQTAALASLNSVLAEPIEQLLLTDAHGEPTIETRTTGDLEDTLGLPGGHIFHGDLAWPFAEDDAVLETPAQRWGVATAHERILLCGSGARRGGAVSGIGGHNAAMAVLERG